MPTHARREVVAAGEIGLYHCVSRCVRRARLCGFDPVDQRSYEHRKAWVEERLKLLATTFGMEIGAYAVMSNHVHVLVRTRPDVVQNWTDAEVAQRWRTICPRRKKIVAPSAEQLAIWRCRLASLSWFMRMLVEPIARWANREDKVTGRFWEGRFHCQAIVDDAALVACMSYIDLNPIRAGVAETPETSRHTSAYERIAARQETQQAQAEGRILTSRRADWLCPILLADVETSGRRGLLPLQLDEYLTLLDWTGRQLRSGKPGAIPADLAPILVRLHIRANHWFDVSSHFLRYFPHAAGKVQSLRLAAQQRGRRWYHGIGHSREVFENGCQTEAI